MIMFVESLQNLHVLFVSYVYFKEKNALVDQLGALEEPTIING